MSRQQLRLDGMFFGSGPRGGSGRERNRGGEREKIERGNCWRWRPAVWREGGGRVVMGWGRKKRRGKETKKIRKELYRTGLSKR